MVPKQNPLCVRNDALQERQAVLDILLDFEQSAPHPLRSALRKETQCATECENHERNKRRSAPSPEDHPVHSEEHHVDPERNDSTLEGIHAIRLGEELVDNPSSARHRLEVSRRENGHLCKQIWLTNDDIGKTRHTQKHDNLSGRKWKEIQNRAEDSFLSTQGAERNLSQERRGGKR